MKAGIILDVEATPAHRTSQVNSTKTMIDRVEARFELPPEHLDADTLAATTQNLRRMADVAQYRTAW